MVSTAGAKNHFDFLSIHHEVRKNMVKAIQVQYILAAK